MAITFKEWLKLKFSRVVSVQAASLHTAYADIALHMWSGNKIHIYMIDQPSSTRAIKRALNESTSIGVNSMFLVDARILPPHDSRTRVEDWLIALHEINNDRIYTYRVSDDGPEIIQVHLEAIKGSDEFNIWYGPKIKFKSLRHRRKSIQMRAVRGDWLIADFGSPSFWQNTDYRAARAKAQRARPHGHNTYWQTFSSGQTWAGTFEPEDDTTGENREKQARRAPIGSYLDDCYKMLGVKKGASQVEIKRAYRKRALMYHPDTSELPGDEADIKFKALNAAYDYIKSANGWS
jgi:hypothetical protein